MRGGQNWQDRMILVIGLWLVSSPWTLSLSSAGGSSTSVVTWNFLLSGTAAIFVSYIALGWFKVWEEAGSVMLGGWLIASPWALHFSSVAVATWNAVLSGSAIVVLATWCVLSAVEKEDY